MMSSVLLIIICGARVTLLSHHYRIIERLLLHNPSQIRALKHQSTHTLDAGYILIDCNAQLIINAQVAINLPPLPDYAVINAL